MWEIFAVGIIIFFVFSYIGTFNVNTFIDDNKALFEKLREDDYNFLLIAKYGEQVDCNAKFNQRVKTSLVVFLIGMFFAITSVSNVNFAVKLVIVLFITYLIYKDDYNRVKNYYKVHLHDINLKLPYYLKRLEILIQHYTVPVALTKSLEDSNIFIWQYLKEEKKR